MLEKIVARRRVIILVWLAVIVCMAVLAMVYGDIPQKLMIIAGTVIIPTLMYVLVRLLYKVFGELIPLRVMTVISWVILGHCAFGFIAPNIEYILSFPDFFVVAPQIAFACAAAVLDGMAKLIAKADPTDRRF